MKEWSKTMPARNVKQFLSQTESLAKDNWSEGKKGKMPKAKSEISGGVGNTDQNTCSYKDLKKGFLGTSQRQTV
jgi:hypothetical protein